MGNLVSLRYPHSRRRSNFGLTGFSKTTASGDSSMLSPSKGIQPKDAGKPEEILDRLNQARETRDMNFPASGLPLHLPKQESRRTVKVSGNWRITFVFGEGHAFGVNYKDYH
jgi:proteic killer suppression protein